MYYDGTPVGTVEFIQELAQQQLIKIPAFDTYPACLNHMLGRTITKRCLHTVEGNMFVKPVEVKKFTGCMLVDLIFGILNNEITGIDDNMMVYQSTPVKFIAEWRIYVLNGTIVGMGRYDDNEDETLEPDYNMIADAVDLMTTPHISSGYSLDFGLTDTGQTLLVEANDGWALGYYKGSCSPANYARLLDTRWNEISD